MVLDLKLFTPYVGHSNSDFLWIIAVAPGIASSVDATAKFASNGEFWPSYNCPYQENVYVATGFQKAYEAYGNSYSYTNCSRAQMFARDQLNIANYDDFKAELRYNKWQTDPFSNNDPYNSISSRKDLRTPSTTPSSAGTMGGIDSKVVSYSRMLKGLSDAESGPSHDSQTVFQWSGSPWENQVHLGQPDVFNFSYVEMSFNAH